jgi:hypothetical protein
MQAPQVQLAHIVFGSNVFISVLLQKKAIVSFLALARDWAILAQ